MYENFFSINIISNINKYHKMSLEFNKKFNTNISDIQIKNKIQ